MRVPLTITVRTIFCSTLAAQAKTVLPSKLKVDFYRDHSKASMVGIEVYVNQFVNHEAEIRYTNLFGQRYPRNQWGLVRNVALKDKQTWKNSMFAKRRKKLENALAGGEMRESYSTPTLRDAAG